MKGIRFAQKDVVALAQYIAELTRQGMAYSVEENLDGSRTVTVTGF